MVRAVIIVTDRGTGETLRQNSHRKWPDFTTAQADPIYRKAVRICALKNKPGGQLSRDNVLAQVILEEV